MFIKHERCPGDEDEDDDEVEEEFFIDWQSTIKLGKITQFKELFSIKYHDDNVLEEWEKEDDKELCWSKGNVFYRF